MIQERPHLPHLIEEDELEDFLRFPRAPNMYYDFHQNQLVMMNPTEWKVRRSDLIENLKFTDTHSFFNASNKKKVDPNCSLEEIIHSAKEDEAKRHEKFYRKQVSKRPKILLYPSASETVHER